MNDRPSIRILICAISIVAGVLAAGHSFGKQIEATSSEGRSVNENGTAERQLGGLASDSAAASYRLSGRDREDRRQLTRATERIVSLQTSLGIIEAALEHRYLAKDEIDDIRQQVDFIAGSALRIREDASQKMERLTSLLQALGAAPGTDEPPESPRISTDRKRLEGSIAEYHGLIKSANVILARVDTVRTQLVRQEFGVLARILGERSRAPLVPSQVAEAMRDVPARLASFRDRIADWWQGVEFDRARFQTLMGWLVLLVVVMVVIVPTRNWVLRRYGPDRRADSPSFASRFRVMLAVGLGNVVLPVVSILGLYVVLVKSAALTPEVRQIASVLMTALAEYAVVTGLSAAALTPGHPKWRISHFTDSSAVRLHRGIRLFALVVAVLSLLGVVIARLGHTQGLSQVLVMDVGTDALQAVFGALVAVAVALSMLNILRKANWWFVQVDEQQGRTTVPPGRFVAALFALARLALLVGVLGALLGYINLGIFLSQRITLSLLLIAFAFLVRAFIAASWAQAAETGSDGGLVPHGRPGYSGSGGERAMFWVMLVVDILLCGSVLILLLLIWGVRAADILSALSELVYGIQIGSYTLSLVDAGVALGLFVLLLVAVRLFQGFLANRVLVQTVPDVGVRDALTTGIGYAGIVVAVVISISSLGLEFSQLAIIFGALSVGIGFGLQHVVSNFVSGLILLMQRPIKPGDWIVVGQHQGYVRKVNVVSTEIQTFDNADVIVPNSQLVSSQVLNWTHRSTVARVTMSVKVSHASVPSQVREVLLECANRHDDILRMPAPVVVFDDFGDSALIFELQFFIRQADSMQTIASDMRFAINDAFRHERIVFPYPQRDIHIKTPAE